MVTGQIEPSSSQKEIALKKSNKKGEQIFISVMTVL